jgi:hypothetical protein
MAKNKKKKKDKKSTASGGGAAKVAGRLKTITENPLVADVVAAALVATAAALKDSNKARQLAMHAGDELEALAKDGAARGNALWKLALEVGRRSLDAIGAEGAKPKTKRKSTGKRLSAAKARSKSARKPK